MGLQTSLDILLCSRIQKPTSSSLNLPLGQKCILYTVSPPVRVAEQVNAVPASSHAHIKIKTEPQKTLPENRPHSFI